MNTRTAMNLLSVANLKDETLDSLKKKYRKQAKIFHPDCPGGDRKKYEHIKSSYELLASKIKDKDFFIPEDETTAPMNISLDELIRVFKGEKIYDSFASLITKQRLKEEHFNIHIDVQYSTNGKVTQERYLVKRNTKDTYVIHKEINENECNNIKIKILDTLKEANLAGDRIVISFNFDYIVSLSVIMDRKCAE